ncbi:MAG TPA: DUF1501 domain-containing protein [Planctomycetota bacterium]|nr:DUF1501 domain-containing protein [Planctomycetota bacterium]
MDAGHATCCSRRDFLRQAGMGLGSLALTCILAEEGRLFGQEEKPVDPRLKGKAKSVILLWMGGGPSHVDSFDPKPELATLQGKKVPESLMKRIPMNNRLRLENLYPSPFEFRRHGGSGLPVSSLFPETARLVDDLCIIRSMRHESVIHTPAEYLTLTGSFTGTRPTLGAWLTYGMGSENRDLPGYIVTVNGENFSGPSIYQAGFLPSKYQGTLVKGTEGIPNLRMPAGVTDAKRRAELDFLAKLNREQLDRVGADSDLEARIQSYELAYRMQTSASEAFDLSKEDDATKRLYGVGAAETNEYGTNCLLARRLVERGVRFIQLVQAGWDAHGDLKGNHEKQARLVDRPIAGLLGDLKRRGLLDHTLVIWGGEFGRTPTVEGDKNKPGRDHSPLGYTVWLAGGGVKGGQVIGETDEIGYTAISRPVHPNDLQATILRLVGIDQRELYYEHNGRREIVTFNGGEVLPEVFV